VIQHRKTPTFARKKATIYDLSALCGASASTISAVLNGSWRARRIKESTAHKIQQLAAEQGYQVNLQARGLRSARSGLVGLLLPVHDNRYFSSMAQYFQAQVRARGQCPLVVSGGRNRDEERQLVQRLIAHAIDGLLIVGSTDPDALHEICENAGLPHINIDLPGSKTASVISDNYQGAYLLTQSIIQYAQQTAPLSADEVYLFGGHDDHASQERISGFIAAKHDLLGKHNDHCICFGGYSPAMTQHAFDAFYKQHGQLPRAFFVNSSINLEGLLRFLSQYPAQLFSDLVAGCYDYDPFASFLPFPLFMIRQDSAAMIARGLELLDTQTTEPTHTLYKITPQLVPPRTALTGPLDELQNV